MHTFSFDLKLKINNVGIEIVCVSIYLCVCVLPVGKRRVLFYLRRGHPLFSHTTYPRITVLIVFCIIGCASVKENIDSIIHLVPRSWLVIVY